MDSQTKTPPVTEGASVPSAEAAQTLVSRPFDEICIGDTASLTRTLTRADVKTFAVLSGDVNPTHVDDDHVRKLSLIHI